MSKDTSAVKLTPAQLQMVKAEVARHLAEAKQQLVPVDSKPEHVDALAAVWRRTREHYQAQLFRFLGIFGAVLGQQIFSDFMNGKPLFDGLGSPRAIATYIAGIAFLAWRQYKPSMSAKQADSAPGVTIVPDQVGVSTTPEVVVGVEQTPTEGDAAP